ncbi:MAG: SLOG family protein [Candidatus Heritagella sp.]
MHRVCFTGHRPEKLTRSERDIRKDLEEEIRRTVLEGFTVFITGMARGVDIWAAQTVLKLRGEGYSVKLMCACPYEGFERGWNPDWQKQYNDILAAADFVKYICKDYSRCCFQIRNRWMVNHAARVIAVCSREKGGTKNTIHYAVNAGVPVVRIDG